MINPFWTSVTFDTDAQNFISAANITESTQKTAINQLVTDLKSYGIWSKLYAIYPLVGGVASSHKFNLKDPRDLDAAYRLEFNGGWVHSSTGVLGNATNTYANTFLGMNVLPQDNAHLSFYSRTDSNGNYIDMGNYYTTISFNSVMLARSGGNFITRLNTNGFVDATTANSNSKGFYQAIRNNSTQIITKKNYNTSATFSNSSVSAGGFSLKYYLGNAQYNGSVLSGYYSNREYSFFSLGEGLTTTEQDNFYLAVQKFQSTLGRQVGVPLVSDSDAQAFLNAAVIENQTQADAINQLVLDLKTYNIWTKMKAIYPFVGGTAVTHKFNLKNPLDTNAAFRIVFNGGWTHDSNGATPNGINGYADTCVLGGTNIVRENAGMGIYSRTNTTNTGAFGAGGAFHIHPRWTNNLTYWRICTSSTGGFAVDNGSSAGLIHGYSNPTNSSTAFYNGTKRSTFTGNVNIAAQNVLFGSAGAGYQYDGRQLAFAFVSGGLSDSEASNLYTAVQAYQTRLGRQV